MAEKSNIWDLELEVKALKTVLTENVFADKMYSFLKPEHFHFKITKALFTRLQDLMLHQEAFPSWQMLITDARLEEGVQSALKDNFEKTPEATAVGDLDYLCKNLNELASKRQIYATIYETQESLYDPEKSAKDIASEVGSAIVQIENEDLISELNIGSEYNDLAERVFFDIVHNKTATNFVPTGYKSFDGRSGGHQRGNLVLIGANTSGGKSLFALNLMTRQYLMGFDVVMASYEMNYHEILARQLAIISEIPMEKIIQQNLTNEERRHLETTWREYKIFGKKNGNNFYLSCPTNETTVTEIGLKYKSRKPTSIIFDYINLLTTKSKHSEAQWQALGEIAKEAKILAARMNCVVYMLIQIDKEHNLRYSQAIKDHANWAMGWVYDEEARTNGFVTVKQMKTRNAPSYDFQLVTRFDLSQFRDPDEEDKNKKYTEAEHEAIAREAKELGAVQDLSLNTENPDNAKILPKLEINEQSERTTPTKVYELSSNDEDYC